MSDMRDALRKAGLASERKVRQVKHQDRVRRKNLGEKGIEEERRRKDAARADDQARKQREDRGREADRRRAQETDGRTSRLYSLLSNADLMAREGGPRRFYFEVRDGRIAFLDVSPPLAKRLAQGEAAVVDATGVLKGDYIAIDSKAAHELDSLEGDRIIHWNIPRRKG